MQRMSCKQESRKPTRCYVMSPEQWQNHCSLMELCLPFHMGGDSDYGYAPPDYDLLRELAQKAVLWGSGIGSLVLHSSLSSEYTPGMLSWFPADQVAFSDRHAYVVTPDVNYYRRAIGRSELAVDTVRRQSFVFVHPESAPVVYSEPGFSLVVNPGEILFGVRSGEFTSDGDAVMYRFVTSVTERRRHSCVQRSTQNGGA